MITTLGLPAKVLNLVGPRRW